MNNNNNHIIFNNRDNNRAGDMSPDLRNAESPVSRVPPRMLSNALAGWRAAGRAGRAGDPQRSTRGANSRSSQANVCRTINAKVTSKMSSSVSALLISQR